MRWTRTSERGGVRRGEKKCEENGKKMPKPPRGTPEYTAYKAAQEAKYAYKLAKLGRASGLSSAEWNELVETVRNEIS